MGIILCTFLIILQLKLPEKKFQQYFSINIPYMILGSIADKFEMRIPARIF